jgi:hypothetical protein
LETPDLTKAFPCSEMVYGIAQSQAGTLSVTIDVFYDFSQSLQANTGIVALLDYEDS